ncbi:MAG: penicillin-insensitive murein endopeptidase [Polyangiales bacterium]
MASLPKLCALALGVLSLGCGEPSADPVRTAEPSPAGAEALEELAQEEASPAEASMELAPVVPPEPEAPPLSEELAALLAPDAELSRSVGGPNDGRVEAAVAMPDSGPGFRYNARRPNEARYGTGRMVRALIRAAMRVHEEMGGEVTFNDLGLVEGGPIPHHGSHRAGRDVDVLFYLLDENDEPHAGVGAFVDPTGHCVDFGDLRDREDDVLLHVDVPRTWAYVEALVETSAEEGIPLQRIFLVEHVRTMLLDYARENGGDAHAIERFEMLSCQPGAPHDDHFHFRFFCPVDDIGRSRSERCTDARPHYPWRIEEVEALGSRVIHHTPRRDRPMAPITTPAQARRAVGPMAPEPREWLRRRRAWQSKPHPRREWCR